MADFHVPEIVVFFYHYIILYIVTKSHIQIHIKINI